jgi:lysophosphatidylcholine acyltransferase/lyso-PAF acetyltransferase
MPDVESEDESTLTRRGRFMTKNKHLTEKEIVTKVLNPFKNNPKWNCYELTKRVVVGVTIFPIRVIVLLMMIIVFWLVSSIGTLGAPLVEDRGCFRHTTPFSRWRYFILWPITPLYRIFLWCFGFWWISFRDSRIDKSDTPKIIVVAPHTTMFDMIVLMYLFPNSGFLGQRFVVDTPVLNKMGTAGQGVYIDLKDKNSKDSCKEIIAARASAEWTGYPMTVFPEGTITNGKQLVQFKAGAFGPGEPVLPVVLKYPWRHYDISWVGKNRHPLWGIRCALQVINYCEVHIMEVQRPCPEHPEEMTNPIAYANRIRHVIATQLNLPTTEHSYDDVFFYREAAFAAGVGNDFEVKQMKKLFNADLEQLKDWLELFRAADKDNSGTLSCEELKKLLDLDGLDRNTNRIADKLFSFFDTDHSGSMEYREFVQLLALLSGKCDGKTLAKFAFMIYDTNSSGKVKKSVLIKALNNGFAHNSQRDLCNEGEESDTLDSMSSIGCITQKLGESLLRSTSKTTVSADSNCIGDSSPVAGFNDLISFDEFQELIEAQPEVIEAAVGDLRARVTRTSQREMFYGCTTPAAGSGPAAVDVSIEGDAAPSE